MADGIKQSCVRVVLVLMNLATLGPRIADSMSSAWRRFSEVIALTFANARNPVPFNIFSGEPLQHFSIQSSQGLSIKRALEFDLAFKGKKLEPAMTLRQLALRDGARLELRPKG